MKTGRSIVVLDAFDVRDDGKGVSRALVNIVPRLAARASDRRAYVVLSTPEGARLLEGLLPNQLRIVPDTRGSLWEQVSLPWFARSVGAKLIYMLREVAPLVGPPYILHIPEDPEVRWRREPPKGTRERTRATYQRFLMRRSLSRASALLAISSATAQRMERQYGLVPGTISPVPLAVEERFLNAARKERGGFVFHLGSSDPRDNTVQVIRAYGELARQLQDPPELIVGGDLGSLEREALSVVPGVSAGVSVRFLGRVSDESLGELYAGALVCVQPASDEGFGLQPLEAMATGAAVIVLDTPAVREVVGDAADVLPSLSPQVLATHLRLLIESQDRRRELGRRARLRAATFRWDRTVDQIESAIDVYLEKN